MSELRVKAFVLRSVPYGENRHLLELLTDEDRLITFSVGDRDRRISKALTQAFVFAEFELYRSGTRYKATGGRLIHAFLELQEDWDRLTAAAHLAELLADALRQGEQLRGAYELWAYSLQQLCSGNQPLLDVRIAQYRFLCIMGFTPWLQDCVSCHEELDGSAFFSEAEGGILCSRHARFAVFREERISLNPDSRACLRHLANVAPSRLFLVELSEQVQQEVIALSDLWCRTVMEKEYRRLTMTDELAEFTDALAKDKR